MIALTIAGFVAGIVALFITPLFISWLRDRQIGQQIRQDGPRGHHVKAGTPTIGGVCIVVATVLGYAVAHSRVGTVYTRRGILVIGLICAAAFIGFLDDWIKVRNGRSLGLTTWQKMGALVLVSTAFALAAQYWANVDTHLAFTRANSLHIDLGVVGWIIFAVLVIVGSTNAVNLTDGLDGLAAGASTFAFSAFAVIGFWQLRHFGIYQVQHPLDLAVIAAAMAGACMGFLWWNAAPAKIFMGDTGSLAIGAGLAGLALTLNVHLLLPIVGGLFVVETVSVILQVFVFRFFNKRRLFRMAPMHHHLELGGWPETHVIIRFWILAGICTALALGIFYADFLSLGQTD